MAFPFYGYIVRSFFTSLTDITWVGEKHKAGRHKQIPAQYVKDYLKGNK